MAELPQPLFLVMAALFGLIVGSFLNVCIYRVPRDMSIVAPRSFCPTCQTLIPWYDNVPVFSFLLLGGKCRSCGNKIGSSYPLVELITAATFVYVAFAYGLTAVAAKWLVFECGLIVLFWTDWQERLLPDEFTLGGAGVGLLFAWFVPVPGILSDLLLGNWSAPSRSLANAAAAALLAAVPIWLLGWLYSKLRKREGLGFGDVKLLLLLGVFLGPENTLLALTVGATGGALTGMVRLMLHREDSATYELPFGSFLCAAGYLVPLLSQMHFDLWKVNG